VGRVLAGLTRPTSGAVMVVGVAVLHLGGAALRRVRQRVQVVFQDPYASLNPRMTVRQLVREPLSRYGLRSPATADTRVDELLAMVGLSQSLADRRPLGLSGGQRQRVAIARALAAEPEILILDEPVSALDVSIRAQVLNLLAELRSALGLTCLFISHDLSVVRWMCNRVLVMYHGRIVEAGDVDQIFNNPRHPYTRALLSAIPVPNPTIERRRRRIVLPGEVPSAQDITLGCDFSERCWLRLQLHEPSVCVDVKPYLQPMDDRSSSACHFASHLVAPKSDDRPLLMVT
jgi:oligopeptide/dipeptide ABC transporter ATP-binding protein